MFAADPSERVFLQRAPEFGNQYLEDAFLRATLHRLYDGAVESAVEDELCELGDAAHTFLWKDAKAMDRPENKPSLKHVDAWGERVDDIVTCEGWGRMKEAAAKFGVVADGYDSKKFKSRRNARLVQYVKLHLFAPSSGMFSCPLAMTDGAAKLFSVLASKASPNDFKASTAEGRILMENALRKLTARRDMWTSGQFMTQRYSGSDLNAGLETLAFEQPDGTYKLNGYKFFTSATDADLAVTIARVVPKENHEDWRSKFSDIENVRKLPISCFVMPMRNELGKLNSMDVVRMKDKLGTRQLPTAEIALKGSIAHLASVEGRGIPAISSTMVNITRLHNAVSSCSNVRRIVNLLRDYSTKRVAFGRLLSDNELHLETLKNLEIECRGMTAFTFDLVAAMGRHEDDDSSENVLRLLTPVVKVFTAKVSVACVSEGIEGFGAYGYMEDTGLPCILRDNQVTPIWEGASNLLSNDFLRVLSRKPQTFLVDLYDLFKFKCLEVPSNLKSIGKLVLNSFEKIREIVLDRPDSKELNQKARAMVMSLGRCYAAACLLEHAAFTKEDSDAFAVEEYVYTFRLVDPLLLKRKVSYSQTRNVAMDVQKGEFRWQSSGHRSKL